MTWQPFELCVVRSTGFAYDRLRALADDGLVGLVDRRAAGRARADALASVLMERAGAAGRPSDPAELRRARRVIDAVRTRRPVSDGDGAWAERRADLAGWAADWNEALAVEERSEAAISERYASALTAAREALERELTDERVREALFLLTPEIVGRAGKRLLERRPSGSAPNQDERKIASYLQRLCAKCETNAFAGPIAYGWTGAEPPAYLRGLPTADRRGYVAYWALRALLATALDSEDWASLPPRRGPAADLLELPEAVRDLLSHADGKLSWREVAARADRELPSAAVVKRLERAGVAWTSPQLPASEPDALAAAAVADHDGRAGAAIAGLRRLADRFAREGAGGKAESLAAAERLLADAGVGELRRGEGQMYVDRTVLYEEDLAGDRGGPLPAGALAAVREALGPVLGLAARVSAEARAEATQRTRAAFRKAFPDRSQVSFAEFLRAVGLSQPVALGDTPTARRLRALVGESWDGQAEEVALEPDVVSALAPTPDDEPALLASPDVFLSAPTWEEAACGDVDVVVGEIHWGLQLLGNLCCFIDDRPALLDSARRWLADVPGADRLVNVALGERYGKMAFLEAHGRTLELSGPAAPERQVLHPGELVVDAEGRLRTREEADPVLLALGDPVGAQHTPFAPPALRLPTIDLGGFTPRLRVGRAVLQRATWTLGGDELDVAEPRGAQRYAAVVERLRARGVPQRVYARVPGEAKPLHIDLGSPHLVDLLHHAAVDGEVRLTEMLPGPDRLWRHDGAAYCCELRFAFASVPDRDNP